MHGAGQESAVPERLTEGKRNGAKREAGRERRVRNGRAGKTTGEHNTVGRFGRGEWELCCGVEGRVPPCGGGSGGETARKVRRAWAWRSVVEGSGGGEDSTGRGGKMGPEAGGFPGRERESWTVT